MTTTGLFQYSPYRTGEVVPAYAELTADPLGQVVAVITAYLCEGSSGYDWQQATYLRADFAREKVEHVWSDEGHYHLEGEWDLDPGDEDVRERLLLTGGITTDLDCFATLAAQAPDLAIAPPEPDVRGFWGEDTTFVEGVPDEDWQGPEDG